MGRYLTLGVRNPREHERLQVCLPVGVFRVCRFDQPGYPGRDLDRRVLSWGNDENVARYQASKLGGRHGAHQDLDHRPMGPAEHGVLGLSSLSDRNMLVEPGV